MKTNKPFTDPLAQESRTGCTLTTSRTGAQFSDLGTIISNLAKGFLGWDDRDMALLLIKAEYGLAPDQQIYTITIQAAQK
jgi:hypothetical protein